MKGILLNDFFEIISQEEEENMLNTTIKLSVNHQIFEGHFPDRPITPGVCLIQIVKEILMHKTQCSLLMVESSNIKFLNPVNPHENDTIMVSITYSFKSTHITVAVIIGNQTNTFCKFQALYNVV
jgi:3-hydroxyacyl-[acyl-carrier-protein] dehydratase